VNITGSLALGGNIAIQTGSVTQPYALHTVRYGGSSGNLLLEGNDTVVGQPAITFKNNNGNITNNISQLGGAGGLNLNSILYITASNVGIGTSTVSESVQSAGSISIIPVSSVSSGPLIQFAANGRIRPADTGNRLSIDGNPLYLNNTFNTNVVIGLGNLGIGVVPTANWGTTAIQMNHYGSLSSGDDGFRAYTTVGFGMYDGGSWTPKYVLGGSAATAYRQRDGAHEFYTAGNGTIDTAISFTKVMSISNTGTVAIGVSASAAPFAVYVNGNHPSLPTVQFVSSASNGSQVFTTIGGSDSWHGISLRGVPSVAADWSITPGNQMSFFEYGGDFRFYEKRPASLTLQVQLLSGTIYALSTSISSLSDIRLKENIRTIGYGLNEIIQLQPKIFDWKEGQGTGAKNNLGFIAQDVETVLPELVTNWSHTEGETAYKSLKMGDMIPVLVKAIQELQAQIDELKNK
jgi:hypothetical protein